MTATNETSWSQVIRRQAYKLIILVVMLGLIAAGYLSWHNSSSDKIQRLANDYHLASVSHYLRAMKELHQAESYLGYDLSTANIDTGSQAKIMGPGQEYNSAVSYYLIQQEVRAGLELQHTFADIRFDSLAARLEQRLSIFEESGGDYLLKGVDSDQVFPGKRGLVTLLNQLVRLHTVVRDDLLFEMKAREESQAFGFLVLVFGLLLVGFLIMKRGLRAIDAVATERKQAEVERERARVFMQVVIDGSPDVLMVLNRDYTIALANRAVRQLWGGQDLVAACLKCHQLSHGRETPCDSDELICPMKEVIGTKASVTVEHIHYDAQGHEATVEIIAAPIFDEKGEVIQIIESSRDITERKRADAALQEQEQLVRDLLDSTAEAIYGLDMHGNCTFANPACGQLLGYRDADELIGENMHDLIHYKRPDGTLYPVDECPIFRAFKSGDHVHVDTEVLWRADGSSFPAEYWSYPIQRDGEVIGAVVTFMDITDRKRMEEELEYLATHDPLTGLYNRNVLEQRLNAEIHRASRYNHTISVFMLDIDHFKSINDTHGHQTGDAVLRGIAKLLESSIRKTDYVARYGGEEFVTILPETPLPKAEELATRMRIQVAEHPFSIGENKELNLTVSIGIATFPEHAQTWQDLLEVADSAMYAAKNAGRNQVMTP